MTDVQLGGASYTPGNGSWDGAIDASQLAPGDTAKIGITFPFPINFVPGDAIAWALGPVFSANGQTLRGVDFEGDSTLVFTFVVNG